MSATATDSPVQRLAVEVMRNCPHCTTTIGHETCQRHRDMIRTAVNAHEQMLRLARRVATYECTCHDFGDNPEGLKCEACEARNAIAASEAR